MTLEPEQTFGPVPESPSAAITERVKVLEVELAGLARQASADRTHASELLDARLSLIDQRIDSLHSEIGAKLDDLKSRKGETRDEFARRIEVLDRHASEADGRLEALETGIVRIEEKISQLLARGRDWRAMGFQLGTGATLLVAAGFIGRMSG